jgi:hypothetical protein
MTFDYDINKELDKSAFNNLDINISDDGKQINASGNHHLTKSEREYIKDLAFRKGMQITDPEGVWERSVYRESELWGIKNSASETSKQNFRRNESYHNFDP